MRKKINETFRGTKYHPTFWQNLKVAKILSSCGAFFLGNWHYNIYIYISAVTQELFDFFSSARKETYCVSPLKLGILVIWFCQHFGEKPSNSNRSYLHLIPAVLKV